jgi:hypothetical protein
VVIVSGRKFREIVVAGFVGVVLPPVFAGTGAWDLLADPPGEAPAMVVVVDVAADGATSL